MNESKTKFDWMKKNDDLPQNDVKEEKKEQNSMLYVDNTFGGK